MSTGLLVLRVTVGLLFAAHGAQKLFGWFGGYGLDGTGKFFESIGFRPGKTMAFVAGATELGAGLLLALGLGTPLAAAGVVGVMVSAIASVKLKQGLFNGYEGELLFTVVAIALAFTGAGTWSLDTVVGFETNAAYGLGAVALGLVTGFATLASRRPQPAAAPLKQAA